MKVKVKVKSRLSPPHEKRETLRSSGDGMHTRETEVNLNLRQLTHTDTPFAFRESYMKLSLARFPEWSNNDSNGVINSFKTPLPIHVQQAAAAKTLGILARESPDVAQKLLHMGVIHGLMVAMGNEEHSDSQRQAALSLEFFVTSFPFVDDEVRTAMGDALYNAFAIDPERLPVNLTPVQADVLRTNRVDIVAMIPKFDADQI